MPARTTAPIGSPCWADLWTSDVERARRFYGELFGWDSGEPDPTHGGYFMFNRGGEPVAGGMAGMPGVPAANEWTVYLATDDADKALEAVEAAGGQVTSSAMAVDDLGVQATLSDPAGAAIGVWQAKAFAGFGVLGEPGAPSWFELLTSRHADAVAFYRSVFRCQTETVADTDEFRYTLLVDPAGGRLAGIMDVSGWGPAAGADRWSVYWQVPDVDAAVARVTELGGSVLVPAEDTPYGHVAGVADPAGAGFKLRTPPA